MNSDKVNKKWFDKDCNQAKSLCKQTLNIFKKPNFDSYHKRNYTEACKAYKNLLIIKKKQYTADLKNKLAIVGNAKDFWTTFKKFSFEKVFSNPIPINQWETFYKNFYFSRSNL